MNMKIGRYTFQLLIPYMLPYSLLLLLDENHEYQLNLIINWVFLRLRVTKKAMN